MRDQRIRVNILIGKSNVIMIKYTQCAGGKMKNILKFAGIAKGIYKENYTEELRNKWEQREIKIKKIN